MLIIESVLQPGTCYTIYLLLNKELYSIGLFYCQGKDQSHDLKYVLDYNTIWSTVFKCNKEIAIFFCYHKYDLSFGLCRYT